MCVSFLDKIDSSRWTIEKEKERKNEFVFLDKFHFSYDYIDDKWNLYWLFDYRATNAQRSTRNIRVSTHSHDPVTSRHIAAVRKHSAGNKLKFDLQRVVTRRASVRIYVENNRLKTIKKKKKKKTSGRNTPEELFQIRYRVILRI